ncbi:MAG: winged helix-turn-helix domain-containing protein, partial [Candidatus Odinarchaeota archaeon]
LQLEMPDKLTSGTMEQIKTLQEKGAELSKKPWKKITTGSIYTLPQDLHGITLAMLSLEEGEGTVEEIAKESSIPSNDALKKLTSLQKLGYIGKKHREGKTVYFRAS